MFSSRTDKKEDQLYEVNALDSEKTLFQYSSKMMNQKCSQTHECISFLETIKNSQPYNFEGVIIRAIGKKKGTDDLMTFFFEEGI